VNNIVKKELQINMDGHGCRCLEKLPDLSDRLAGEGDHAFWMGVLCRNNITPRTQSDVWRI